MMALDYQSLARVESVSSPGIFYVVERMSFARRLQLMKAIREAAAKAEFHEASGDAGKMALAILSSEVDRIYVQNGLRAIEGLVIDGETATAELLCTAGPENLFQEALVAIKAEISLNEEEKKT